MTEATKALPEMTPVESSNIAAIGHDAAANELHVRFTSGAHYVYPGVDADAAGAFHGAESKGSHFAKHIRAKFAGTKL